MYHEILSESFKNTYCFPNNYIYNRNAKNTTRQQILKMKWQFGKIEQYHDCFSVENRVGTFFVVVWPIEKRRQAMVGTL